MRVIRRVYNTFAFQSCDIEVPAVGTGSTSNYIYIDITAALRAVLNIACGARARAIFYISTRAPARGGDIFV